MIFDAVETRKDAQLARDIEIGLPIELKQSERSRTSRSIWAVADWAKNRNPGHTPTAQPTASPANDIDARQQAAAERWAARQQQPPAPEQGTKPTNTPSPTATPSHESERDLELRRDGPEDDLNL